MAAALPSNRVATQAKEVMAMLTGEGIKGLVVED